MSIFIICIAYVCLPYYYLHIALKRAHIPDINKIFGESGCTPPSTVEEKKVYFGWNLDNLGLSHTFKVKNILLTVLKKNTIQHIYNTLDILWIT